MPALSTASMRISGVATPSKLRSSALLTASVTISPIGNGDVGADRHDRRPDVIARLRQDRGARRPTEICRTRSLMNCWKSTSAQLDRS